MGYKLVIEWGKIYEEQFWGNRFFCETVRDYGKKAGYHQNELAQECQTDKTTFNRKLHNQRNCNFGPLDRPEGLVELTVVLIRGKTQSGIPTEEELDKFTSSFPLCLASNEGRGWVKREAIARIAAMGIPWNIPKITPETQIPVIHETRPTEIQALNEVLPMRDAETAKWQNDVLQTLWEILQELKALRTREVDTEPLHQAIKMHNDLTSLEATREKELTD